MKKKIEGLFSSEALEVSSSDEDSFKLITIYLNEGEAERNPIYMKNEDAPTIALAEMEAAGYLEGDFVDAPDAMEKFGKAMLYLRLGIEAQVREAKATAEAKERELLEAEALALFNARRKATDYPMIEDWDMASPVRDAWLAVATKARELAKEATK